MKLDLTSGVAQSAACGFAGFLIVILLRLVKKKRPLMVFESSMGVLATCVSAPAAVMFALYPFVTPKPDLGENSAYLSLAAVALAWGIIKVIARATK